MFNHIPLDYEEIQADTSDEGYRVYKVAGEEYTSVTTMLGETKPKEATEALNLWQERLGYAKAHKEAERCADRGTEVHLALENYIANRMSFREAIANLSLWHQMGMKSVKKYIDNISDVIAQEIPLFSHTFRLAGRVDLVGKYLGVKSIVDFKTSTKKKNKEWIEDYFLQTAIYSYMLEEMFGLRYLQLVIIIEVEGEDSQVFTANREDYKEEVLDRINNFRRIKNE